MKFGQMINDGWQNILSGLGAKQDKGQRSHYGTAPIIPDVELTQMWMGDGLSKKIVSCVSADMVRAGIEIDNDPDGEVGKELRKLKWQSLLQTALNWTRLYGGAIVVVGVEDGNGLDKPVRSTGGKVAWLRVYPRTRCLVCQTDIVTDVNSPYYEEVEIYPIQKMDGFTIRVHASRCLVFKGEALPMDAATDFAQRYWGMSALQPIYDQIRSFGASMQGVSNLMLEFVIGKYTLSNLAEILAENNVDAVYKRLEVINASKSMINAVLLGEGESYSRDTASVSGLPELLDRVMSVVAGVTEIPVTRLFGTSPGGMNATGESDLTNYYDMIGARQEAQLLEPLTTLVNLTAKGMGIDPEELSVEFLPLGEPNQQALVEMQSKQAATDKTYIDAGVLSADEVRENRFVGKQSFSTSVEGLAPEPEEPEVPVTSNKSSEEATAPKGTPSDPKETQAGLEVKTTATKATEVTQTEG